MNIQDKIKTYTRTSWLRNRYPSPKITVVKPKKERIDDTIKSHASYATTIQMDYFVEVYNQHVLELSYFHDEVYCGHIKTKFFDVLLTLCNSLNMVNFRYMYKYREKLMYLYLKQALTGKKPKASFFSNEGTIHVTVIEGVKEEALKNFNVKNNPEISITSSLRYKVDTNVPFIVSKKMTSDFMFPISKEGKEIQPLMCDLMEKVWDIIHYNAVLPLLVIYESMESISTKLFELKSAFNFSKNDFNILKSFEVLEQSRLFLGLLRRHIVQFYNYIFDYYYEFDKLVKEYKDDQLRLNFFSVEIENHNDPMLFTDEKVKLSLGSESAQQKFEKSKNILHCLLFCLSGFDLGNKNVVDDQIASLISFYNINIQTNTTSATNSGYLLKMVDKKNLSMSIFQDKKSMIQFMTKLSSLIYGVPYIQKRLQHSQSTNDSLNSNRELYIFGPSDNNYINSNTYPSYRNRDTKNNNTDITKTDTYIQLMEEVNNDIKYDGLVLVAALGQVDPQKIDTATTKFIDNLSNTYADYDIEEHHTVELDSPSNASLTSNSRLKIENIAYPDYFIPYTSIVEENMNDIYTEHLSRFTSYGKNNLYRYYANYSKEDKRLMLEKYLPKIMYILVRLKSRNESVRSTISLLSEGTAISVIDIYGSPYQKLQNLIYGGILRTISVIGSIVVPTGYAILDFIKERPFVAFGIFSLLSGFGSLTILQIVGGTFAHFFPALMSLFFPDTKFVRYLTIFISIFVASPAMAITSTMLSDFFCSTVLFSGMLGPAALLMSVPMKSLVTLINAPSGLTASVSSLVHSTVVGSVISFFGTMIEVAGISFVVGQIFYALREFVLKRVNGLSDWIIDKIYNLLFGKMDKFYSEKINDKSISIEERRSALTLLQGYRKTRENFKKLVYWIEAFFYNLARDVAVDIMIKFNYTFKSMSQVENPGNPTEQYQHVSNQTSQSVPEGTKDPVKTSGNRRTTVIGGNATTDSTSENVNMTGTNKNQFSNNTFDETVVYDPQEHRGKVWRMKPLTGSSTSDIPTSEVEKGVNVNASQSKYFSRVNSPSFSTQKVSQNSSPLEPGVWWMKPLTSSSTSDIPKGEFENLVNDDKLTGNLPVPDYEPLKNVILNARANMTSGNIGNMTNPMNNSGTNTGSLVIPGGDNGQSLKDVMDHYSELVRSGNSHRYDGHLHRSVDFLIGNNSTKIPSDIGLNISTSGGDINVEWFVSTNPPTGIPKVETGVLTERLMNTFDYINSPDNVPVDSETFKATSFLRDFYREEVGLEINAGNSTLLSTFEPILKQRSIEAFLEKHKIKDSHDGLSALNTILKRFIYNPRNQSRVYPEYIPKNTVPVQLEKYIETQATNGTSINETLSSPTAKTNFNDFQIQSEKVNTCPRLTANSTIQNTLKNDKFVKDFPSEPPEDFNGNNPDVFFKETIKWVSNGNTEDIVLIKFRPGAPLAVVLSELSKLAKDTTKENILREYIHDKLKTHHILNDLVRETNIPLTVNIQRIISTGITVEEIERIINSSILSDSINLDKLQDLSWFGGLTESIRNCASDPFYVTGSLLLAGVSAKLSGLYVAAQGTAAIATSMYPSLMTSGSIATTSSSILLLPQVTATATRAIVSGTVILGSRVLPQLVYSLPPTAM